VFVKDVIMKVQIGIAGQKDKNRNIVFLSGQFRDKKSSRLRYAAAGSLIVIQKQRIY